MYLIKVEHSFDSAHFLSNYIGKCANIHGHRWRVEVELKATELIQEGASKGMVVDFTHIKAEIKGLLDSFDHALIIEEGSMRMETLKCLKEDGFKIVALPFRTTAEKFSEYFFNCFKKTCKDVHRVTVYETPTNSATFEG